MSPGLFRYLAVILLFTDFGSSDPYVGQVRLVLQRAAPGVPVVDLLNDLPPFQVRPAAQLLAALAAWMEPGDVALAVVDPGVGTPRAAVAINSRGRWFVGPDNGLLSVVAARDGCDGIWHLPTPPHPISATFHGRDVFAPIAAHLALRTDSVPTLEPTRLTIDFGAADLAEVIFVDHYGNAMTGLRNVPPNAVFTVGGVPLPQARTFADVPVGRAAWIINSLGLVEIVVNEGSAARLLSLRVGDPIAWS